MKKLIIIIAGVLLIGGIGIRAISPNHQVQHATPIATHLAADRFSYQGQPGKDALTLLKEKAKVQIDAHGLVAGINNRIAQNTKHEYWAFYVNGKFATAGPADYQTKNTDLIEWKIEKY